MRGWRLGRHVSAIGRNGKTLADRRSCDTDVFVCATVIEQPAVSLADHAFDKNHIRHLSHFFPLFFRTKYRFLRTGENLCGILFVDEDPAGGIKKVVVGAVVPQENAPMELTWRRPGFT